MKISGCCYATREQVERQPTYQDNMELLWMLYRLRNACKGSIIGSMTYDLDKIDPITFSEFMDSVNSGKIK